jgi:regulatory protein
MRQEPPPDADHGPDADPESVARKILLDRLTGEPRSRADLERSLARKHVPEDVARRLLDRFTEVGLVDDQAFARSWVESRQRGKGLARRALAMELRRKGIEPEVAALALDDVAPEDEARRARELVRRKLRSVRGVPEPARTRRPAGHAGPKGLSAGVALDAIREELGADEEWQQSIGEPSQTSL